MENIVHTDQEASEHAAGSDLQIFTDFKNGHMHVKTYQNDDTETIRMKMETFSQMFED